MIFQSYLASSFPPFLFLVYLFYFLYSTDLVSVTVLEGGLMAALWELPGMGALFHLGA